MVIQTDTFATSSADLVKETSTLGFAADVVEASMSVPVIVDFWAPWCAPCKQLGPILEREVQRARGRVRLVKINIDTEQALAAQLRVQSVPTVYAFVGGRPVDGFVGAQGEQQVRAFIDRLLQLSRSPAEGVLEQAQALLDAGKARAAADLFLRVLKEAPQEPKALAGLIRARVAAGDVKGARKVVEGLPAAVISDSTIAAALAAVDLAEEARHAGDIAQLRRHVEAHPEDFRVRFELAQALYGMGAVEGAIDELLTIVRKDRSWNEEAARKQLIKIFDALGPTHPLTIKSRRRLSSILFS